MKKIEELDFVTSAPFFDTKKRGKLIYPFGPCIYQNNIDDDFKNLLLDEGKKLTKEKHDWRHQLAGNMKHGGSYIYQDEFIKSQETKMVSYVADFLNTIEQQFGDKQLGQFFDIQVNRRARRQGSCRLDTMWINYQHQFDYNPPHAHRGALSFVIFLQVPERIFTESTVSNTKDEGKLVFYHGAKQGTFDNTMYPIKPYENLMFIFPAEMQHAVPPFWTDDERISVAGNFVVV